MNAETRPSGPVPRRRTRFALMLSLAVTAVTGCSEGEAESSEREQNDPSVHDKVAGQDRFAQNLAARANTYCRCAPPLPPRFPYGDGRDQVQACVALQAAHLLQDSLTPVTIKGPMPSVDAAQRESLSQYIEYNTTTFGACELTRWMTAVKHSSLGTDSRGTVLKAPVMRADRRHPSVWSDVGFVSASKRPDLTTSAAPFLHYSRGSSGSQVWVSATTTLSGRSAYRLFHAGVKEPDVCIRYLHEDHRFEAADPTSNTCSFGFGNPVAWEDGSDIITPLVIGYVYSTIDPIDVYLPDRRSLAFRGENEVLTLGFRPRAYRGQVEVVERSALKFEFSTNEFAIEYDSETGCQDLKRPEFSPTSPFEGLRQGTAAFSAGVSCRASRDACATCFDLTVPASVCLTYLLATTSASSKP